MDRRLFQAKKSLFFQIKRFIYDDLRYKKIYFVHRKTLLNNLFVVNGSYFYILWRFFYIQDRSQISNIDKVTEEEIQRTNNFKIYNQFLANFLNVNYLRKHISQYSNQQDNFFQEANTEKLAEMLYINKQNITELFYISPLNIKDSITKKSLQYVFLSNINLIEDLITPYIEKSNISNYNFYDVGIVSKIIGDFQDDNKSIIDQESLFMFIKNNTNKLTTITDGIYKTILWNILNNGVIQNKTFIFNSI